MEKISEESNPFESLREKIVYVRRSRLDEGVEQVIFLRGKVIDIVPDSKGI
ncbi:MAG: hypothetical protein M3Q73_01065 [bacterium]|nr:hypothetical protein [bacterium]